jgi:hypothetical protein
VNAAAIRVAGRGVDGEFVVYTVIQAPEEVDVTPYPGDLDVGLVDEPAITDPVSAEPGRVSEQRGEPLNPPIHRDMVDLDTPFGEQFLNVAIGQPVAQVPPDRHHDHLRWKPEPKER